MTTPQLRRIVGLLAFTLVLFTGTGCDSGGGDGDGNGGLGSGSMSASVGGDSFEATVVMGTYTNGVFSVAGNLGASSSTQKQINIAVPNASVGSHSVGLGITAVYSEGSSVANLVAYAGVSGTITIDELSESSASGSFSFTGRANDQSTKSVTNGTFEVDF